MNSIAELKIDHSNSLTLFKNLENKFYLNSNPKIADRISGLKRLRSTLTKYRSKIIEALDKDFAKPKFESEASEILVCLRELDLVIRNLKYWSQNKSVDSDILLFGTKSYIRYEPRGVVLIISPWNYPVNLSLCPLIAAYAAGNKIILKPSEFTSHTSDIIEKIISESFSEDDVIVVQGDALKSAELVQLPFNLIFFTGSGSVAKEILKNASANLTPCVLELGGKCPVIIDEKASLSTAVEHIAFAKLLNAGQTCIAPDFVVIHQSQVKKFTEEWDSNLQRKFGLNILENEDYCGIINQRHYDRLKKLISEGIENGGIPSKAIEFDDIKLKIKPVLLLKVDWDSPLMKEEIFGPILPIITYTNRDELCIKLRKFDRPLNLYIFSRDSNFYNYIIDKTRSGGVTINQCILNYVERHLPFGGDHQSGNGRYHGQFGFTEFSHMRSITMQSRIPSSLKLFYPPYTHLKIRIKNILLKLYS
ncbi:MAG: aldehyde dehydrogenase family protein [Saprospiraceae bacterium]